MFKRLIAIAALALIPTLGGCETLGLGWDMGGIGAGVVKATCGSLSHPCGH